MRYGSDYNLPLKARLRKLKNRGLKVVPKQWAQQTFSQNASNIFFETRKYSVSTEGLENMLLYSWAAFYYGNQTSFHDGSLFRQGERNACGGCMQVCGLCSALLLQLSLSELSSNPQVLFWLLKYPVKQKTPKLNSFVQYIYLIYKVAREWWMVFLSCPCAVKSRQSGVMVCSGIPCLICHVCVGVWKE